MYYKQKETNKIQNTSSRKTFLIDILTSPVIIFVKFLVTRNLLFYNEIEHFKIKGSVDSIRMMNKSDTDIDVINSFIRNKRVENRNSCLINFGYLYLK